MPYAIRLTQKRMKENIELHNDINEVPILGEWIETLGDKFELPMPAIFQLNLALEEAVVNVMSYAYPGKEGMPVRLDVEDKDGLLVFTLEDDGIPFDPTQTEDPDITLDATARDIGGLGTFLIRKIMSDVAYQRRGNTNVLTMTYSKE